MQVEAKIPLGDVRGRIDHLAVDIARRRIFIAELGNDSLGVIDLAAGATARRIRGLREPQGVAYVPGADTLLVANAGDGTVERYRSADLTPLGPVSLGADADNLRPDPAGGLVWVGHGGAGHGAAGPEGGLTALDAASGQAVGPAIPLPAHPESFQLEAAGPRVFVNLPGAGATVAVLDRAARRQVATWSVPGLRANFPMALDERGGRLFVAFRGPPTLAVLDLGTGATLARLPLCEDADDVFLDARRHRVHVTCGEGAVETFEDREGSPRSASPRARADCRGRPHRPVRARARPALRRGPRAGGGARRALGAPAGPAAVTGAPLPRVAGLTKRYGDQLALAEVGFGLGAGEVLGLIGPNGAGKTTVLECLAGLLPADGAQFWAGEELHRAA